ncbi:MAG TPA: MBL fold metallo-hydrolase [Clostridiales bacterium]|nr:MBL fold metallo-hydrolase [Clostridiales bacterium]
MFAIQHLKGNTYFINAPTNIGLYKLDEKNCILIDACHPGPITDELLETLEYHHLHVHAILNTHGHIDHFGSIAALTEKYHSIVAAAPLENSFIEYPDLYVFLLVPFVPSFLDKNLHMPKGTKVEMLLEPPRCTIQGIHFDIVPLPGHTSNHIGIATPDNILFAGDAFTGEPYTERIKIYYHQNISDAIDSMRFLLKTNYDAYVPSHGNPVTTIENIIQKNIQSINSTVDYVYQMLSKKPLGTDEILSAVNTQFHIPEKFVEYYIAQSCIISVLSFLENSRKIQIVFDNGMIKFTTI